MGQGSKLRREALPKPNPSLKKDFCERCGTRDKSIIRSKGGFFSSNNKNHSTALTIHHRNHNPADNRPHNLQTLCRKCHQKWHDENG